MLERARDGIDVSGLNDDSLNAVADDVARFAGRDLRQTAGRRFVNNFRAALPLRWKNVHRALTETGLRVAHETESLDVLAPKSFQVRPGFIMHRPDQPQFCIRQIKPMP